jgi:hypothetical protein
MLHVNIAYQLTKARLDAIFRLWRNKKIRRKGGTHGNRFGESDGRSGGTKGTLLGNPETKAQTPRSRMAGSD